MIPTDTEPIFSANYPGHIRGHVTLLPTPERVGALPEYTGRGVVIAFLDSGYYAHTDLRGRIRVHIDATTDEIQETEQVPKSPAWSWHGQMTTVIGCGDGSRSAARYRGIASGAELVLIKVSNERNQIKEDDILRGLRWVLAHHERWGIRIVNLSVGGDYISYDPLHPLHRIVRDLTEAGVLVVAAAGNRGLDHLVPPASAADALTVGGLDDNNSLDPAEWSLYSHNHGMGYDGSSKPDLIAPACWIASPILPSTQVAMEAFWLGPLLLDDDAHIVRQLIREGRATQGLSRLFGHTDGDSLWSVMQERIYRHKIIDAYHQHVDGTSVAAPIVSAVAAQMLEANPALRPREMKHIMKQTARPLEEFPMVRQGAGVLNPAGAVRMALQWP